MYVCMLWFQTIPDSSWQIPCGLVDHSQWAARKHFDIGKTATTVDYVCMYVCMYVMYLQVFFMYMYIYIYV